MLEALKELLKSGQVSLDFIGDGVVRPALEQRARDLNIKVRFHGWIPEQAKVQEMLSEFHVLAFPSIREFGGGVVVEAMAKGVVPIVMDFGGPGEIVTSQSGVKLPMENREQTTQKIRDFVERAAADPSILREMSFAAQQRVLEAFSWQGKVAQTAEMYRSLIQKS